MASRLNLGPLVKGVLSGLRHRSDVEDDEKPDWPTRTILVVIPVATIAAMLLFHLTLSVPDAFLAAAALLAGALLTGFSQVAAWRERILTRDEEARTRALNEAAAHILASLVLAVFICGLVVTITVLPNERVFPAADILRSVLSALAVGTLVYVGLTLVIVANLLWDAFQLEKVDALLEGLDDLESDES